MLNYYFGQEGIIINFNIKEGRKQQQKNNL